MIDLEKVERLLALMNQYGVDRIAAESGSERVSLSRGSRACSGVPAGPTPQTVLAAPVATSPASPETKDAPPEGTVVTSPFVGTFYRSPGPDAPKFVEVGGKVRKGSILCIVEAMKLMNEIESEIDGIVEAVLVENGKVVEFGTPLFVISEGG